MKKKLIYPIVIFLSIILMNNYGYCFKLPKWFPFNRQNSLEEWREKIFKGRVIYEVKPEKEKGYLLAKSDRSASGIFYRISFDARKNPMISWKWRVIQFPRKQNQDIQASGWIEKDDYAARFYVIFPSFYFMNTKCLEYVWDENLPKGKILTSPYFKNIKLIVAESGSSNLNNWVYVRRNIIEDYKAAFGRPPRDKVGAIAIMTDSDNTNSTAEADYSEIKVGYGEK